MSEIVQLGRGSAGAAVALPHTVALPTRYYGRMAVAETAREFSEVAEIAYAIGDGTIDVTFSRIEGEAAERSEVIGEFLNHALYASVAEAK
jgi:hypothetical protein